MPSHRFTFGFSSTFSPFRLRYLRPSQDGSLCFNGSAPERSGAIVTECYRRASERRAGGERPISLDNTSIILTHLADCRTGRAREWDKGGGGGGAGERTVNENAVRANGTRG